VATQLPPTEGPRRRPSIAIAIAAVIAGVLAGAIGANSVLRQPSRYFSRIILQIDQPQKIAEAGSQGPLDKLNQLRAKYAVLAKTRRVTSPVAQKTGLHEGLIAGSINVTLPGPSLIMVIDIRTGDSARARTIADAVGNELVALVKGEMDAAKIPEVDRIVLTVVAPAQPGVKFEPTRGRAVTTGTLAGILSLVGVIALAESARAYRRKR
jgi:capsular polysaccharide biosynthesis protein